MPDPTPWFCYLLECADGSLYAGITTDLARRVAEHNRGTASRYTRSRRPVRLAWSEPHPDRAAATRREGELKVLPRAAKLALTAADVTAAREPAPGGRTTGAAHPPAAPRNQSPR